MMHSRTRTALAVAHAVAYLAVTGCGGGASTDSAQVDATPSDVSEAALQEGDIFTVEDSFRMHALGVHSGTTDTVAPTVSIGWVTDIGPTGLVDMGGRASDE